MRACVPVVVSRCLEPGLVAVCVRLVDSTAPRCEARQFRCNHVANQQRRQQPNGSAVQAQVCVVNVLERTSRTRCTLGCTALCIAHPHGQTVAQVCTCERQGRSRPFSRPCLRRAIVGAVQGRLGVGAPAHCRHDGTPQMFLRARLGCPCTSLAQQGGGGSPHRHGPCTAPLEGADAGAQCRGKVQP